MSVEVAILKLLALLSETPDELWVMGRISQHSTQITAATKEKRARITRNWKQSAVLWGRLLCEKYLSSAYMSVLVDPLLQWKFIIRVFLQAKI